jgi:hypothetical protein
MAFLRFFRENRHQRSARSKTRSIRSGFVLATVLMVIFLAMIAAFVYVNASVFQMNTVQRVNNNEQAKNMAESVIAQTLEKVMKKPAYGKKTDSSYDETPTVTSTSNGNAAIGILAFNPSVASNVKNTITNGRENIPWSYNNLEVDAAKSGCGRTVPQFAIHLVGTGISNGVVRHVEAIIHVPPFPYAIASSGKFEAGSGLLLTAVKKAEDALNGASAIPPEKLVPSHLASNSKDVKAIKLGKNTKITGDVRSSGGIETDRDGGTDIQGKLICNADAINLPVIDVTSYDPEVQKMEGFQSLPATMEGQKLEGASKREGNLTVDGDLTLNGGLVYVNGDLTIHGSVKGKGGLFVTGKTTIDRGAKLETGNSAVLVSKGDVSLGGTGKSSSSFQGMIYTEGNFTAKNITLLGSYVANGSDKATTIGTSTNGNVNVENADIIGVPEYTKVSFDVKLPPKVVTTKTQPTANFGACWYDNRYNSGLLSNGYQVGVWGQGFDIKSVYDSKTDTYRADWVTNSAVCLSFEHWNSSGQRDVFVWKTYDDAMRNYPSQIWGFALPQVPGAVNATVNSIKAAVQLYNSQYQEYKKYLEQLETGSTETSTGSIVNVTVDMNQFLKLFDQMRVVLWKEWEPVKK